MCDPCSIATSSHWVFKWLGTLLLCQAFSLVPAFHTSSPVWSSTQLFDVLNQHALFLAIHRHLQWRAVTLC